MAEPTPDLVGFVAAQDRLREQMGSPATFLTPTPATWPVGTAVDREGIPLDPRINPEAGTGQPAEHTITVTTLFRGADAQDEAIGWQDGTDLMIDLAIADWPDVQNADKVIIHGQTYELRGDTDQGFDTPDRVILFATSVS